MTNNEVDYILVVEDSPDVQKLMCLYLDCEDFEVLTAADGYDAIKKVMKFRPKVVLTKGYFNNEDEFGLIKTIRHTKEFAGLPVVAMLDRRNGHIPPAQAGATKIILVPEDYEKLPEIIREFIKA